MDNLDKEIKPMIGKLRTISPKDRKLLGQSVALIFMVLTPAILYKIAQSGAIGWTIILLCVLAAAMALAIVVS